MANPNPSYEDLAFGGAGRDVLVANTGGDRLIDWSGEYDTFLTPFAPFGMATVSRTIQPQLPEFLYALSKSDGADQTLSAIYFSDPARNGEPFGELGLVTQQDAAWQDQKGAPRDPQAGNVPGGQRDVLRTNNTSPIGSPDTTPTTASGSAATLNTTFAAPAVATTSTPGKSKKTLTFVGPAGSTAAYTVTDTNGASVTGTALIGDSGVASLDVDVSTLADGTLTVTVVETDALGNTAPGVSISWVKDSTPAGGSFTVNNTTPVGGLVTTNNRFLSLALNFADAVSGVAQVAFSADGGASWQIIDPGNPAFEAVALPSTDGIYSVTVQVTDNAGNVATFVQQVRLDTTGPAIVDPYLSSLIYDVGQTITFSFGVSDPDNVGWISSTMDGTSVASSYISSQIVVSISVDGLGAGTHVLVVTAQDTLGNTSSVSVTFQVHATAQGLINAFNDGVANGKIAGNQTAQMNKLQAAQAAMQRGDRTSTRQALNAFVNQVQAQSGKSIDAAYATLLVSWANDLISRI